MKKLIVTILTLTALSAGASEITGRDIMQMVEDRDSSLTSVMETAMFIQRGEQTLERRTVSYRKKYGVDEKSLIRFEKPADVRDTMYLTWSYEDPEREDDMWLYLPAESLVRRISGGGKKGAFMRSDFANEDIQKREVDDDTHRLIGKREFSGINCYEVESVPVKKEDTNYSKKIVLVHPEMFLVLKTEYYDKGGRMLKTAVYGGFVNIDGIDTYTKVLMETPSRKTKTFLERSNIRYNEEISDTLFEQSSLKR
jgi:outer membrane lipoprotein-sorting protein